MKHLLSTCIKPSTPDHKRTCDHMLVTSTKVPGYEAAELYFLPPSSKRLPWKGPHVDIWKMFILKCFTVHFENNFTFSAEKIIGSLTNTINHVLLGLLRVYIHTRQVEKHA